MTSERKPVFDAILAARGKGFDAAEVAAIDALLDRLGVAGEPAGFDRALAEVLTHEGGWSNHSKDPGGMTNLGVTKTTWEAWTGRKATEADMRALTVAKVKPLYKARYWDAVRGDDLPAGLGLCVLDFAVNAGPARSARYLQAMVGAMQDGMIGPVTIGAVNAYVAEHGEAAAVRDYQQARRDYYRQLKTFPTFGRGWLRRVDEVQAEALRMAR